MTNTTLNDILFPVEIIDTPMSAVSGQSKQVIGYHGGEPKLLNTCSPTYNLIPNMDIYPILEKVLDNAKCKYSKKYEVNKDFTIFNAKYVISSIDGVNCGLDVKTGKMFKDLSKNELLETDLIYPTLGQGNSYDGYKTGNAYFGFFRMICSNGLVVPYEGKEETNFAIKGKHTAKLSISFNGLIDSIKNFIESQKVFVKRFQLLTDRFIPNWSDRLQAVLEASNVKTSKSQLAEIEATIRTESAKLYDGHVNDWLIYNGINGHTYKGVDAKGNTSKKNFDVKMKIDSKVLKVIMA